MASNVLLCNIESACLGTGEEVSDGDTLSDWILAVGCGCLMFSDVVAVMGGKLVLKNEDGGGGRRC